MVDSLIFVPMKSAGTIVKFKLPLKYFAKYYHDIISAIRIHNGQTLVHDKMNNHIVFEVKFIKEKEVTAFNEMLKTTQVQSVK